MSPQIIIDAIAKDQDVPAKVLTSRSRKGRIANVRHLAFFIFRYYTDLTFREIGEQFNRSHGTVLTSLKSMQARLERDTFFRGQMEEARQRIVKELNLKLKQ